MRVLAAVFVVSISAAHLSAREPTQQDYDIWASAIPGDYPGKDPVYVWHLVESPIVFTHGRAEMALEKQAEFRPAANAWQDGSGEIDIERLNAAAKAAGQPLKHPMKVLDQRILENMVGKAPKPSWVVSPRLTSGVQRIYRLSWPLYREDGRAALLLIGDFSMWQAAVRAHVLGKNQRGRWWPTSGFYWTLLCWGSGPPVAGCDGSLFIE